MTPATAITLAIAERADSVDLPLFIHVLSALVLIGAIGLGLFALAGTWRGGSESWRLAYLAIVWAAIPAWVVLRGTAEWLLEENGLRDAELEWIDIGFAVSEPTLLLLILAGVIARVKAKRTAERGDTPGWGGRIASGLVSTALIGLLFALWAMTTKPV